MKVILTKKLAGVGEIGDIVEVKNGYGKNFLIPKGRAIYFSEQNYKFFKDKKEKFEAENKEAIKFANENKSKIDKKTLTIIESASDDGRLYGSVNTTIIASKVNQLLNSKDHNVSKSDIIINKSVKEIGKYDFKVELYSEIEADITLIVARSEDEAKKIREEGVVNSDAKENNSEQEVAKTQDKPSQEEE